MTFLSKQDKNSIRKIYTPTSLINSNIKIQNKILTKLLAFLAKILEKKGYIQPSKKDSLLVHG